MAQMAGALVAGGAVAAAVLSDKYGIGHDIGFIKKALPIMKLTKRVTEKGFNLISVWNETVSNNRDRIAVIFENKRTTFSDMERTSNQMAAWLQQHGFAKGDTIALMMQNKPEFICWWLACAKLAIKVALINYNIKTAGLIHCIKVANSKGIIFDGETWPQVETVQDELKAMQIKFLYWNCLSPAPGCASVTYDDLLGYPDMQPPPETRNDICLMDTFGYIYTSGTTGLPKAGIITHLRMIGFGSMAKGLGNITPDDTIYTCLPLFHSAGGGLGSGTMVFSGCTLALSRKFSPKRFWVEVIAYRATVVQYIGELCRYLVNAANELTESERELIRKSHCVRFAIGNGLRPDVWGPFQDGFAIPTIIEFYGATEGNGALVNLQSGKSGRGAIGRQGLILQKTSGFKLAKYDIDADELSKDQNGFCVESPLGTPGELLMPIRADRPETTFVGYTDESANKKKVIRDAFAKGDCYFRSGDLLSRDAQGYWYFVDRIGDTFRWKGENVSTTEVSEVVSSFPGILEANAYVVLVPGAADGRACMVSLTCESNDATKTSLAKLLEHCEKNLPKYAWPLFLRFESVHESTATMKQIKTWLRKQGCNPSECDGDEMFWLNPATKTYDLLDAHAYEGLPSIYGDGRSKL